MYDRKIAFGRPAEVCRVVVQRGAADRIRDVLLSDDLDSLFFLTDKNVARLHKPFFKLISESFPTSTHTLVLPAGEKTKSMQTQLRIHEWLLNSGASRASMIVGVGGGVICDITGFAASTFMRGIPHALVPTTLLAQVDAAIGGKNGINLSSAKNMIGTIRQPMAVIADPAFLDTLSAERIREGISELIKLALVRSQPLGRELNAMLSTRNPEERMARLERSIELGVSLKLGIVRADPFEKGLRKILNFGHTTAHALEAIGHYGRSMPHGKAVTFGMLVALDLSRNLCDLDDDTVEWAHERIRAVYGSFPIGVGNPDDVWKAAMNDKKRARNEVNFVLLETYAKPTIQPVGKRQFASSFARVARKWSGGK